MTLMLNKTENSLNPGPYWNRPIESPDFILTDPSSMDLFDQNGYHLTEIEKAFATYNGYKAKSRREEYVIREDWYTSNNPIEGPHLNHSDIFQRRGFNGEALSQLKYYAEKNPLLWKLIKMKPKWGIDISIDYVDRSGNVFELFHYEWDGFDFKEVYRKKEEIEKFIENQDWERSAELMIQRMREWTHLDFFQQSKWKTDFYSLPPENFKNIIWETN